MTANRFSKEQMEFGYGLVRTDDGMRIIDKNLSAAQLIKLPRRGASIKAYFSDRPVSDVLGRDYGATAAAELRTDKKTYSVVVFREKSGTILMMFHPLIANFCRRKLKGRAAQLVESYLKNILEIISESENGCYCVLASPEKAVMPDLTIEKNCTVATAVRKITDKLESTDLRYNLTVIVDKIKNGFSEMVNFTTVGYVLSEALTVLGLYGEGKHAVLSIGNEEHFLTFDIRDRARRALCESDRCFARVFNEMMKMLGVGSRFVINGDGYFDITLSVQVKKAEYVLREAEAVSDDEIWGYVDYWREYFGVKSEL